MKTIFRGIGSFFAPRTLIGPVFWLAAWSSLAFAAAPPSPVPAPQSLGAFELHAPRLRTEADAWAQVAGVDKTDAERLLLARGRPTLLGNVVEVPAWAPYRGIEPALKGLRDYGYIRPAEQMRTTLLNWVAAEPTLLREYYDSKTGEALGARRFSWTGVFVIAFVLDWENDNLTWFFPDHAR